MYSVSQVLQGLKNPLKSLSVIRKDCKQLYGSWRNSWKGSNPMQKDWDNLILLDGCRYDTFCEKNMIDGELSQHTSNASTSQEFFAKNFDGGSFPDVVYFSANPHINKITAEFHDLIRLWETDWDADTGTVLPEDAIKRVIENESLYEDKRMIVHLMQPHRPFLGELALEIEQSGLSAAGVQREPGERPDIEFWWNRLEEGEIDRELVYGAYTETLEETLPHIERLVDFLSGKTVISADHSNMFGEDGIYGHPGYTPHDTLLTVPWLEIDGDRREIVPGETTSTTATASSVEERLEALGYT